MNNSGKLLHIDTSLSVCTIQSSMINDSIAKKLQAVTNIRIEKLRSNIKPTLFSILPSKSFKDFTSQLAQDLSALNTILIPLLILPKSDLPKNFLIAEFSLARRSVNGWPIAVLRESDITNENIFLSKFISLVIDLSKLLIKSKDNILETDVHNDYLFQILPDIDKAPPLLKLFLAKMGQFHHKQRNQLSEAFFNIDKDLNTTWDSLLKLCDTEESKYLPSCKTNRIMPNIWHWLTSPYYSIFELLKNELQSHPDKGHNKNFNQPLDLFHSNLPVVVSILTDNSEQFMYKQNNKYSTNFTTHSIKFDELLKINCISPNSPVNFTGSPQDSFPDNLMILLPNSYPKSEQLSDIVEWASDCYAPSEGSVLWIGNETVAVVTKENLIKICSVPQSQPLSNLSVGTKVTTGQKLLSPTVANTKKVTPISNHSKKLIETSIFRSKLLKISKKNLSGTRLFNADLFRKKPFINNTTEHISTAMHEQTRGVWRSIPQAQNKLNINHNRTIELLNTIRMPLHVALKKTLSAFLNPNFLLFKECYQAFSSALTASQNTKGVIMSVEYLSLLEAYETQLKLAMNSYKFRTQNTFNELAPSIKKTLFKINQSLQTFQDSKKPNPFPTKYFPLKEALKKLDQYISKEYEIINSFVEFINKINSGLNCDIVNMKKLEKFSFSMVYWENEILKFPENCENFKNLQIFSSKRGDWLEKRFEKTIIPNFSNDYQMVTKKLRKTRSDCEKQCSKLLDHFKKINEKAKDAQNKLDTYRKELKIAEDNLNESLKQMSHNLELLTKISTLLMEVV